MSIYVFAEGATEEKVLERIKGYTPGLSFLTTPGKGKDQVNNQMIAALGPLLEKAEPIRCLILRDLDAHVGETSASIVQSVENALNREIKRRLPSDSPAAALQQHPGHRDVYTMTLSRPDLRLALHIATQQWHTEFVKATIDDYVLSLAVQPTTANALIARKGWAVSADDVLHKVTTEIPSLLSANGIPLQEAKDYVRLYAAVIQEHTSPPVFAGLTLAHADAVDVRRILASLLAAIEFVRS